MCNVTPAKSRTTILRKKADRTDNGKDNGSGNGESFSPISLFTKPDNDVVDNAAFVESDITVASTNSPFIRGLLSTAERHGSVELSEPMLHALIEEMTMLLGKFDN